VRRIGHAGNGFAFDNEGPVHNAYVNGFEIASRAVNNGEFLQFIQDGGYTRPEFWLSDVGRRASATAGPHRCIGSATEASGRCSRSVACARSTRATRYAM